MKFKSLNTVLLLHPHHLDEGQEAELPHINSAKGVREGIVNSDTPENTK